MAAHAPRRQRAKARSSHLSVALFDKGSEEDLELFDGEEQKKKEEEVAFCDPCEERGNVGASSAPESQMGCGDTNVVILRGRAPARDQRPLDRRQSNKKRMDRKGENEAEAIEAQQEEMGEGQQKRCCLQQFQQQKAPVAVDGKKVRQLVAVDYGDPF